MRLHPHRILLAVALALAASAPAGAQAVVDQEQLVYDGGTGARTLPGFRVWQSFTAEASGDLVQIDMGFFNQMSGTATLEILAGDGSGGPVLATYTVPVVGLTQPGVTWNDWPVLLTVSAGTSYTFRITPDSATLPDPYGVAIGEHSPYPRGVMGLDDPSGSYRTDFDVVFRTWVKPAGLPLPVFRAGAAMGLAVPANEIGTAAGADYDDLAPPPPSPVLFYQVGTRLPEVIYLTKESPAVHLEW